MERFSVGEIGVCIAYGGNPAWLQPALSGQACHTSIALVRKKQVPPCGRNDNVMQEIED
jgi:hypothetical protein